ncbi:hypothetical protein GCM10011409_35200 [Lentibacillus populi]|uniref:Hydroxyacid dehydrogenase n=1 Tax=Lentibacillus populi TaxID=1827502 RepID=A0A9W5U073_9BACI|nr:hydroxyacid dehydrogenase [Lentibacillus populi]GGB54547.1 hypothetical protein GCM10011409_35200 [Lentibacillus populi]
MNVLVTELIWEVGIEELNRYGYTVDYNKDLSRNRSELLAIIPNYDAIIVRNETKVDKELLEAGINLQVIGRLGVGLDNIDLQVAKEKDVKVVVAKHANATSVAEYVIAAMLDAYRPLYQANVHVRAGNWDRKRHTGYELNGKTLGLIGLGEISHRVAKRANAFGIDIVGYDPFITPYDHVVSETGVKQCKTIEDLLSISDFVSIHLPLTQTTKNMLNKETFSLMKPRSFLINTSRGGIINDIDLCDAVKNGVIAGAYLDVLESEPILLDSPLIAEEAIHLTPHVAGLTEESQQRTSILVAQEVTNILRGKRSLCLV